MSEFWDRALRRRFSRRSALRGAALAGAGTVGLATACATSGGAKQATAPQAAGGQPQMGGTLNTLVVGNIKNLDFHKTGGAEATQVPDHAQSLLVRYKTSNDPNTTYNCDPEPDLALSWESPDALTWTFKLRPNAKYHNIPPVNGRTVQSEDVKASFIDALTNPAFGGRGQMAMLDQNQIQTPAPDTVVFKLKYAYAPFDEFTGNWTCPIFPHEAFDGGYDPSKTVIGSGPFTFGNYTPDVAATFQRNPDWFMTPPYIATSRVAIIPDVATQLAQFAAGNIDVMTVGSTDLDTAKRNSPRAKQLTIYDKSAFEFYGHMNDPASAWRDIRVRRAASLALDRDALGKAVVGTPYYIGGHAQPAFGKWALKVSDLGSGAQNFKYDPTTAKQLIAAAGAADQIKRVMFVTDTFGKEYEGMAAAVSAALNAVGFKTQLVALDYVRDWQADGKGVTYGNFPADTLVLGSLGGYTFVEDWLTANFTPDSTRNKSQVNDPTLASMLTKMAGQTDVNQRLNAVYEIERYLAEQMYYVPTVYGYLTEFVQPRIQNFQFSANDPASESYTKLWIQQ